MVHWNNKVAVVTGASAGIGLAIALRFLEDGMIVVGLARRENKLKEVHSKMDSDLRSRFHPIKCDVSNEGEVRSAFKRIKSELGGVDVLVNNAAILARSTMLEIEKTESMKNVVDTNIMGVIYCTQEAFASMKERMVDGHVVMINATTGHCVPAGHGGMMGVYAPTKFAMTAMVESFRQAFFQAGTKIKVSNISPGGVDTGMSNGYNIPKVSVDAITDAVTYVIGTPPGVQGPLVDMERWVNKVAVVTGASSGIGLAISLKLLKNGMIVVGLARREGKLKEIQATLESDLRARFHPVKCDVSKEKEVREAFKWIKENLGGVDVLVNNAGVFKLGHLTDAGHSQNMRDVLDTNVMGVTYCTQEAFASMKERNFDGHVIMISSVVAHLSLSKATVGINMYQPSKCALKSLTDLYRNEFLNAGTKVKVTSISPGMVESEMTQNFSASMFPKLQGEDIADAAIYVLGTPPHVQVHELIIKPIGESF